MELLFFFELHILTFVFYLSFFYFYDAITEPHTGGVDLFLHMLNHMAILPEPLLSSHLS